MRVVCKASTGDALPINYFERGYTPSSRFDLVKEDEYLVYGISLWLGFILYLIIGNGQRPHWYPAELFQVSQAELPKCWYFAFLGHEGALNAIWGYDELVNSPEHYDQLSNLEPEAEEVFHMRRQEIDTCS